MTTQAAMAWPRPTPSCRKCGIEAARALKLGNGVRPISMCGTLALRIAFRRHPARHRATPVVAGRRSIVIDRGRICPALSAVFLAIALPPRRVLGMEPLTLVECLVELADDWPAVADQRHFGRLLWPISSGAM